MPAAHERCRMHGRPAAAAAGRDLSALNCIHDSDTTAFWSLMFAEHRVEALGIINSVVEKLWRSRLRSGSG